MAVPAKSFNKVPIARLVVMYMSLQIDGCFEALNLSRFECN